MLFFLTPRIASIGQEIWHSPQSMQESVMMNCSPPSIIADAGQTFTQTSHFIHSEVITKDIF